MMQQTVLQIIARGGSTFDVGFSKASLDGFIFHAFRKIATRMPTRMVTYAQCHLLTVRHVLQTNELLCRPDVTTFRKLSLGFIHCSSFPATETCPRICRRRCASTLLAAPWITGISAGTTRIVCRLHRAIVLARWRARRRWWRMPAGWQLLLLSVLLLAVTMLCSSGLRAVALLPWWRREVLLVGGRRQCPCL